VCGQAADTLSSDRFPGPLLSNWQELVGALCWYIRRVADAHDVPEDFGF
jgi:hypothetical protein